MAMQLVALAFLVLACSVAPPAPSPTAIGPSGSPSRSSSQSSASPEVAFGDGTFRVPEQVAPGTYRTVHAANECYWTRLGGFSGGLADLLASRISAGFEVATIRESDAGFDSVGCGDWTADLADDEGLVDVAGGTSVRWVEDPGWTKDSA